MKYKVIFVMAGNEKEFSVENGWEIASTTGSASGLYILLKQKQAEEVRAPEPSPQNSAHLEIKGYKPYTGEATCMGCESKTCRCFSRLIG